MVAFGERDMHPEETPGHEKISQELQDNGDAQNSPAGDETDALIVRKDLFPEDICFDLEVKTDSGQKANEYEKARGKNALMSHAPQ